MSDSVLRYVFAVLLLAVTQAVAVVRYVDINSPGPSAPYTNWATAANVIQDAVDAADPGDDVLVTNGVYATGGKAVHGTMTNRVAVDKPLTLLSVNGPAVTHIKGYQLPGTTNGDGAVRCVYLADGAFLSGFTLTNGATRTSGDFGNERGAGGVWCESANAVASNCFITGNSANYIGGGAVDGTFEHCIISNNSASTSGGGVYDSVLTNCTLTGNSVIGDSFLTFGGGGAMLSTLSHCLLTGNSADSGGRFGGGAYNSRLTNCTLTGNSAVSGGGAYNSTLNHCTLADNSAVQFGGGSRNSTLVNCIVYFNGALIDANHVGGSLNYCATLPLPSTGLGNITNAPLFVDTNGWGNLHLQSNSPCINAGNNAYVTTTNDLDGNPRIVGGAADMGAYEFQSPQSVLSYAWLQQYGLPTDGSADYAYSDTDPHNNWQEWKAWTDPTDGLSVLRMLSAQPQTNGIAASWQSVAGHSYTIERTTDASASFLVLQSNLTGQAGSTTFTDTTATNSDTFLYRVGVVE